LLFIIIVNIKILLFRFSWSFKVVPKLLPTVRKLQEPIKFSTLKWESVTQLSWEEEVSNALAIAIPEGSSPTPWPIHWLWIILCLWTERVGSDSSPYFLYSRSAEFESRPGHWTCRLRSFVVFHSFSTNVPGSYFKLGSGNYLRHIF
jgi:hypothetical protein